MLQTKLAFKIEEIKRNAKGADDNSNTDMNNKEPTSETKDTEDTDNDKQQEQQEEDDASQEDLNPFFREPLYVGNLCLPSTTDKYYRWIVFISTSPTQIEKPKSISSVSYTLHPTHPKPKRTQTNSPFFLDISGWGIFQIDIQIQFKHHFIRPSIDTAHMLSIDSPTCITCIEDGSRSCHATMFNYQHFKPFMNEQALDMAKISFVKKAKHRLKRNLMKTPAPIYFEGFRSTLPQFKSILKECIATDPRLQHLYVLHIPEIIYDIIGYFAVFALSLYNIMPNQEVYIEECHNSEVVISAPKFNHLRLRKCSNVSIKFPYIMSKCELIECDNVNVICTGLCYTFRIDTSDHIHVEFLDPGSRVTFLCFSAPCVRLKCVGVQWHEAVSDMVEDDGDERKYDDLSEYNDKEKYPDVSMYDVPYEKGTKERLSVRWRTNNKTQEWTWKVFHAKVYNGILISKNMI
eukprot:488686_1